MQEQPAGGTSIRAEWLEEHQELAAEPWTGLYIRSSSS